MNEFISQRSIEKGELIQHHLSPRLFIPWADSRGSPWMNISFCHVCGASMVEACGSVPRFDNEWSSTSDLVDESNIKKLVIFPESHLESLPTSLSCSHCHHRKEPMYCSIHCQTLAQTHMFPTLHTLCQCLGCTIFDEETQSTLDMLIRNILPISTQLDCADKDERFSIIMTAFVYYTLIFHSTHSPFYDLVHTACNSNVTCLDTIQDSQQIAEWSFECWSVFYSVIRAEPTFISNTFLSTLMSDVRNFVRVRRYIQSKCLVHVSWPHPITRYIQTKFISLNDTELKMALENLQDLADWVNDHDVTNDEDADRSTTLGEWRKAVRLIQYVDGGLMNDDLEEGGTETRSKTLEQKQHLFHKLHRRCVILDTLYSNLKHSCVPTAILEACAVDRTNNALGPLQYQLSALHPISCGESITVSKLEDLTMDVKKRQLILKGIYGTDFECSCARCICERNWHHRDEFIVSSSHYDVVHNDLAFHYRDLKRLGDLAMQQGRFQDAEDIYSIILKYDPCDGDVLHARCASHLARGNFLRAHVMWREASKLAPTHEGIQLHLAKFSSYNNQEINNWDKQSSSLIQYQTLIPEKCFLTDDGTPLLNREECANIIRIAEAEALQRTNGWTTSRHYAVPTTDLPIHEMPPLVHIFNTLMNRVQPLLHLQFGESVAGSIYIHDAFVVKYDAMKQRHLPLHRDESTHSFIIALNDTCDYDGGGTFIAQLNKALRQRVGGMISFRGDELLHGGDPVVRGIRYIIAAFCYVSVEEENDTLPLTKKRKVENVFDKSTDTALGSTFTFNFQV